VTSGVVVGVGSVGGVGEDELSGLVEETLAEAGLVVEDVRALATLDRKGTEPAIVRLARRHGWELLAFSAEALAAVEVPSPSAGVRAVTGTPSVAEAAALAALAGVGAAELIIAKRRSAGATAAVAKVCGTF
jgi:cobalamin biosynthesis protein CbiG